MVIKLNVPFAEKDLAKSNGEKWNPTEKTWFTDDANKLPVLSKWSSVHNIICDHLYILKMERTCWKCNRKTDVGCLASDLSYAAESKYKTNLNIQLFSYVEDMPAILATYMKTHFAYYPSYSKTIDARYYINHCKYCNSMQGDNYLHEVPEESFYKKLCYTNSKPTSYSKINNQFSVPLQVQLPYYDEVSSSFEMAMTHIKTGAENRESLNITQKLINGLFQASILGPNISINGL